MTRTEVLQALCDARREFMAAIDGLPEADLVAAGVIAEGWSVKDIMAHLAAWEAECVTGLAQAQQGRRPSIVGIVDVDAWNAERYADNKDRPYERVLADYHGVRKQMIKQVEGLTDRDLSQPKRFEWLEDQTLAEFIAAESFAHEREHAAQIKAWRENLARQR